MADILQLFMPIIRHHLTISDLSNLARVSHELNDLITPFLYRTVRFHSPGRIDLDDQLLLQLDILGDPRFDKLVYTRRVVVSGWDMQVSLTQVLLTTVMLRQRLQRLRIRMGTNCTPKPFFRPPLDLHNTVRLRVIHLIQVDNILVLQSLGVALKNATQLERLSIWADDRSELKVSSLLERWHTPAQFRLRSLDLRGFSDIGIPAKVMWAAIPTTKLKELTLEFGPRLLVQDSMEFWEASAQAELRPIRLRVNLGVRGIQDFISSFAGLEVFHLVPSDTLRPMEPIRILVDALRRHHSSTLRVLGLCPFLSGPTCMLDVPVMKYLVGALPDIEELRLSQPLMIALCVGYAEIPYGFQTKSLALDMSTGRYF
ncbi:hypothetical protein BDV26DRAFT_278472 [Aspergillus bertholletiae]|uniref:F-box domain-containing protein n=1 Tax=Aspergillus bertholletiae TaxID=1226010 RepID=A0A5N7BJA2_9EURO|nr:hypothetical protein BDV26DRAFT_278472 [Aspergillus bertholletiae]